MAMSKKGVKLVLAPNYIRKLTLRQPMTYGYLRTQISKTCKDLGNDYDIYHVIEDKKLPVRTDEDVRRSCLSEGTVRYRIYKRPKQPNTSESEIKSPVVTQPSPFDEQPTRSISYVQPSRKPIESDDPSDCLTNPCPPGISPKGDLKELSPQEMLEGRAEVVLADFIDQLAQGLHSNMQVILSSVAELQAQRNIIPANEVRPASSNTESCRKLLKVAEHLKQSVQSIHHMSRTVISRFEVKKSHTNSNEQMSLRKNASTSTETKEIRTPSIQDMRSASTGPMPISLSASFTSGLGHGHSLGSIAENGSQSAVMTIDRSSIQLARPTVDTKAYSLDSKAGGGFIDLQRSTDVYEEQLQKLEELGWPSSEDLVFKRTLLKLHGGDIGKVDADLRDYHRIGGKGKV
mmetsp:Transcript_2636/g.6057  ORF Transcript_2636/g.6057 Transcript_2636/m.6057 type:complete len:403 (+) Transcript_2636:178-1386(+)|eukprot:CAMPEP_0114524902 /NCGR_PEP_ID=MMETSP0109-20121206/22112_1 /TAXON_ID=29199 /ORGANISM="Chlorarachnion reptans, Strain CCCM449" /LENGTH=402 /DNA_ID=CAMNT_0001706395 /DNA_START=161 /DNA_END=1369 /DNA_ORIENTATION=-